MALYREGAGRDETDRRPLLGLGGEENVFTDDKSQNLKSAIFFFFGFGFACVFVPPMKECHWLGNL